MKNSNESVKSRGVVVFAFNTNVDYVGIADQTSRLIQHTLQLPVTLITDNTSDPKFEYDRIIRIDNSDESNFRINLNNEIVTWKNFGRHTAYELSPYNETILLDTDYLVLDDSLLKLFSIDFDYKLMHHNQTPAKLSYESMGETSLPFIWATVVLFRKTERSKLFFKLIGRIQRNYSYYRALYNIREGNYRNDYAFAIANNILNGYNLNEDQGIPAVMLTIDDKITNIEHTKNFLKVRHGSTGTAIPKQSIHIMDKEFLQSEMFSNLVKEICES
jgi:hypothetical protein